MPNLFKNSSAGKILFFCFLLSICFCPYGYAQTTLKIGVYDNKPIIFVDDDGEVQGLFVDLLEEIAIKENWRLEYVVGHFSDVFAQLKEGKIDILPALAYSKQREEIIDYTSETILANWAEIYVPGNGNLTSLLELEGKKVGVMQGDIHFTALKKLTDRFNISCRFIEADEYETVFEMLQANFVHVGVVNRLYGNRNEQEYSVKQTPVIYNPIEMRFGATKGKYQDILTKIDSYMLSYSADGHSIYYQLINRWLAVDTKKVFPHWVFYLFIAVVGATLFFFGASLLFRRQVQRRTKELTNTNSLLESQILERTKAEEKLKVSEERSRTWLEHSPVCTKIVDLDFNLQYMSSAGIKGLQVGDIAPFYGRPYPFYFYPESFNTPMANNLAQVKATGEVIEQEASVVDIDGNELWFHSSLVPVNDEKGRIEYIIIVSIDITERKKAETEKQILEKHLRQAQKMEAIGTLAGGIAHDFNNILGAILGYAEMAKDDAPLGSQIENDLENVLISANRAKELVKQILVFSREAQAERFPLKLQLLIKEGIKMLRSSIPATISITEDSDPRCGTVLADPTQVHQILMNLCTNAYHAMETTGGELSVTLKATVIKSDNQKMLLHLTPGEYVDLTVADTGAGIGPDVIGKIFDPYYTTKEIGKGTGLGLAIIHGIMNEYGGTITVESQLGKGSTFHVYFPAVNEDALPETNEQEDIPRGKERVLFIDDEAILAQMGKDMLERLGYHVTVRRTSFEALETFQSIPDKFDLVITDQTMPGMTGADLARGMLQIRPDIPIILCTGYSNLIDEFSAKKMGIKEFALKPLSKEMIAKLIRKVLDNSQA